MRTIRPYSPSAAASGDCGVAFFRRAISQARGDPAALQRRGRPEQVVVLLKDALRASAPSHDGIDRQAGRRAKKVQQQVASVAQARDEPQAEQIQQGEHDFGGAVGVGRVLEDRQLSGAVAEVAEEIVRVQAQARERKGWIMDTYLLRRRA